MSRSGTRQQANRGLVGAGTEAVAPEAWQRYQSGVQLLNEARAGEALACFNDATAISPDFAEAHHCAGLALKTLGRNEEAVANFQQAINIKHDHTAALCSQGVAYLDLGRNEDAADCFNLALAFDHNCTGAHLGLGTLLQRQKRGLDAIEHFGRAAELDPQSPIAFVNISKIWQDLGQYDKALPSLQRAVTLAPGVAELECNLGILLIKLDRPEEAANHLRHAIALKADLPEALFNLGIALIQLDRVDEAEDSFRRAIAMRPEYVEAHRSLGNVYRLRGNPDKVFVSYQMALALRPEYAEAQLDIGVALYDQGRVADAIAAYEKALLIKPDYPEAQLNLALAWLTIGDFARGWAGYEWRFRQSNNDNRVVKREFSYPEWQGENLAGKRILIWAEQGIGDQLLFASLYSEIVRDARACVIECRGKLVPLLARSFPAAHVVPLTSPPHPAVREHFDYQIAAGSAARWLRPTLESFPCRPGYLVADAKRVEYWQRRLAELGPGPKIGFCWRSSNTRGERALSCTQLSQWGPVLGISGAHFVCLQYDECAAELAEATERLGVPLHAFPKADLFNDLDEAAALTSAVDLVIAAPTAVSILAAALGIPTWQLSYGPDWQTHGTMGNPWFRSMVRFQRGWNQSWDEIMREIAKRLGDLIATGSPASGASYTNIRASNSQWNRLPSDTGQPRMPHVRASTIADDQAPILAPHAAQESSVTIDSELERGEELLRAGNAAEAVACFEGTLQLAPGMARPQLGLGRALRELDRLVDAARCFERLVAAHPELTEPQLELGITRYHLGRYEQAQQAFSAVLAREPANLASRMNRALTLYQQGDFGTAISAYDELLAEHPDQTDARFNLALALLARGNLARGWEEYDWRFTPVEWKERERNFPFPRWAGQGLVGKTILVWKEQSIGSQILFAGMFGELVERAGYCLFECSDKLVDLFSRSFPESDVVSKSDPPHPYTQHGIDYQTAAGSLGRWLRPTLASFPQRCGYLMAEPECVAYWKQRLDDLGPGPKVGFSWRSINTKGERALACTTIQQWEPVFAVRGLQLVCLQYDRCDEELAAARRDFGVTLHRFPEVDMFNDIDETAALIKALTLVVSAPTVVSVLAAALGVPIWQLTHGSDWQMHGARRHPWFPHMRRFERGLYEPWEEVMDEVAEALAQYVSERGD